MTTANQYTYRVAWSDEDQQYAGLVIEFPSLSWLASTRDSALNGIVALVTEVLADMAASNETPPPPLDGRTS